MRRQLAILALVSLAVGCSKASEKRKTTSGQAATAAGETSVKKPATPTNKLPARTPKSKAPARTQPNKGLPPRKPGCRHSVVSLAVKWHEDDGLRRNPKHKRGRTGIGPNSFELADELPDLDGDGVKDVVMVGTGGRRASRHFFYMNRKGCPALVGVISISPLLGFSCSSKRQHGLCVLHTSRMMIHGETEHSTYAFDGAKYVLSGRPTLGPRRTKFRPKRTP